MSFVHKSIRRVSEPRWPLASRIISIKHSTLYPKTNRSASGCSVRNPSSRRSKTSTIYVVFELSTENHSIKTNYGAIESELKRTGIKNPTIQEVSKAVISIRNSKLPDPKILGNSGSFFKNPVVSYSKFEILQVQFPLIPHYKVSEQNVKIPAGWLIETAGYKGKTFDNYGVHNKQALVLVNYGGATE